MTAPEVEAARAPERPQRSIVVIEDEDAIRDVIVYGLRRAGYRVAEAADGTVGLDLVRETNPDLVLLDLMLPGLDGTDVCQALRADAATEDVPVIMLTARSSEADLIQGLSMGADDYVRKPFSNRELLARVEAVLRRGARGAAASSSHSSAAEAERIVRGDLVVTPDRHEVLVAGVPTRLTRTEFELLVVLLRRPGHVFTRDRLVRDVMGDDAWVTERTIDVHVRAIRRKLGERADVIETVRGVGYRSVDGRGRAAHA